LGLDAATHGDGASALRKHSAISIQQD